MKWAARYRQGGFEALAPRPRQDRGKSRVLTPQLAALIERLKRENPHRTGTTLLRELALSGQGAPEVSASTLYRFLKQRGLTERQLLATEAHKKFQAEFAWQKKQLEKTLRRIRDNAVGRANYSTSDFVEDVRCACAPESVPFDNDIFNELMTSTLPNNRSRSATQVNVRHGDSHPAPEHPEIVLRREGSPF